MSKKTHVKTGKQWSANQRKVEALNPCVRYARVNGFAAVAEHQQTQDIQNAVKAQAKIALEQEAENTAKAKRIRKTNPK